MVNNGGVRGELTVAVDSSNWLRENAVGVEEMLTKRRDGRKTPPQGRISELLNVEDNEQCLCSCDFEYERRGMEFRCLGMQNGERRSRGGRWSSPAATARAHGAAAGEARHLSREEERENERGCVFSEGGRKRGKWGGKRLYRPSG